MNTKLAETEEMYRFGYRAECDAHSRDWHKSSAKSHRDLALLTRGADDAKADLAAALTVPKAAQKP